MALNAAAAQYLRELVQLRAIRDRIDREYALPLDVEALARDAQLSGGQLGHRFELAYGVSPYSYLMARRIERAVELLRCGDLEVDEVRAAIGCSSQRSFEIRFTELVGVSPGVYRTCPPRAGELGRQVRTGRIQQHIVHG
ncbi:helix-turn-helix transcriptional regulator [Nocardia pseudobrasiliensis]|nr:helix-turn-helix transcriptional regulator [Nocardia pseudobrasiliensis]